MIDFISIGCTTDQYNKVIKNYDNLYTDNVCIDEYEDNFTSFDIVDIDSPAVLDTVKNVLNIVGIGGISTLVFNDWTNWPINYCLSHKLDVEVELDDESLCIYINGENVTVDHVIELIGHDFIED